MLNGNSSDSSHTHEIIDAVDEEVIIQIGASKQNEKVIEDIIVIKQCLDDITVHIQTAESSSNSSSNTDVSIEGADDVFITPPCESGDTLTTSNIDYWEVREYSSYVWRGIKGKVW